MPARKKVSPRQLEMLLEFAEANKSIALGRSRGPLTGQTTNRAWKQIAVRLNAVAKDSIKTADQWRRYWIEFKARTKTKAADSRRHALATGGGPNKLVPLTELEQRLVSLIGSVPVEGLPAVQNPTDIPVTVPESPSHSSTSSDPSSPTQPDMEVEWLEDCKSEKSEIGILADTRSRETTGPPPESEQEAEIQMDNQHRLKIPTSSVIEDRETSNRSQGFTRHMRRSRVPRPIRRDPNVPRWAYNIEMRRLEVDMRIARGIENLVAAVLEIKEEIRNCNYMS